MLREITLVSVSFFNFYTQIVYCILLTDNCSFFSDVKQLFLTQKNRTAIPLKIKILNARKAELTCI